MKAFARFVAGYGKQDQAHKIRAIATEEELRLARAKLNQTVQNVESGTRIMQTTAGAMRLVRAKSGENL